MNIYTKNPDDKSITGSIQRLQFLVDNIPALLLQIPESDFSYKATPATWSKMEILGHLIDSATNNHQRFIRIRFEDKPVISYNQDQWVSLSAYNTCNQAQLIEFWKQYNTHLVHVIKQIPPADLERTAIVRTDDEEMPLYFYVNDYVAHMEHHLRQIVAY